MTNAELKELISEIVGDDDVLDEIIVLEGDEFADGCIGVSVNNCAVYSYDKLIESLCKHNNWESTDAIEWIEYNTLRALPYMASVGNPPIIIYDLPKEDITPSDNSNTEQ